ncbi:MAG: hypothetical protein L0Z49_07180 [Actinobacteria bacterium]|nr:hypothetical protein [Actinomycetota bacterium]
MDTVLIYHSSLPMTLEEPVRVSKRAFLESWSHPQLPHREEGWQLWPPETTLEDLDSPQPSPPPPKSAVKAAWAAYAEGLGLDPAELNKQELIELVESQKEQ